jgi:hypothetical protein
MEAVTVGRWRAARRCGAAGSDDLMPTVRCKIVRWIAEEPQPGVVEAHITDAHGRLWRFIDKTAIFSSDELLMETTEYPCPGVIRCEVIGNAVLPNGLSARAISTGRPDGVESTEGEYRFVVPSEEVDLT